MTPEDYVNEVVGKPWINRAEGPDAYDCWGIVIDSYRRLDGVQLPTIGGYTNKACDTGTAADEALDSGAYEPCQPHDGAIMTVWNEHDKICHVGRCIAGRVVHATEGLGVKADKYRDIKRRYKTVRYYRLCR